jgi:hypothetical protein
MSAINARDVRAGRGVSHQCPRCQGSRGSGRINPATHCPCCLTSWALPTIYPLLHSKPAMSAMSGKAVESAIDVRDVREGRGVSHRCPRCQGRPWSQPSLELKVAGGQECPAAGRRAGMSGSRPEGSNVRQSAGGQQCPAVGRRAGMSGSRPEGRNVRQPAGGQEC